MGNSGTTCGFKNIEQQQKEQDKEIQERLKNVKHKILVMSGKGGVGKSSIAAYLSVALAMAGKRVGLMDVDLHGPSILRLLGLKGSIGPGTQPGKASPVKYMENMDVISIEALMGPDKDRATIWRGPLKIGVIRQFISDVEWGELDYLVIDSPPGTGDEPLTVAQTVPDAKALIVTTPQEVSLADVRKSINFCHQVGMEILGLVENMSGFTCPHCGKHIELFSSDGGKVLAGQFGIRFLGSLPLDPRVVQSGDQGNVSILKDKESEFSKAFSELVQKIAEISESS